MLPVEEVTIEELQEMLLADEAEQREAIESLSGDVFEAITSEALADHQYLSRSHVCRLCFRWFGFTYAASHGHYSDTKGDFIRRQRGRNRKASYLLCATCGDLPLLCHACFRMVHINQEPQTVTTMEALQAEIRRREEVSRPPSAVQDDSRDASNVSPGSQLDVGSVVSDHHSGVPATLLKRSGLAALLGAFGTDRHVPTGSPRSEVSQRHIALEMFTLDPRIAARQRADVRKSFSLSMENYFADDTHATVQVGAQLSVAKLVIIDREAQRRKEISDGWFSERFSAFSLEFLGQYIRPTDAGHPVEDTAIVPQLTITLSGPNTNTEAANDEVLEDDTDAPFPTGSFHSLPNSSATSAASPRMMSSPMLPSSTYIDTFGLAFLVEAFDAQGDAIAVEESAALQEVKALETKARDLVFANSIAAQTMDLVVKLSASSVFYLEVQRAHQAAFEELSEDLRAYHNVIQEAVIHVLNGEALFAAGAFASDPVDDDGTPITLLWMQFHHHESVERRAMWDEQLSEWNPLLRDAQWRSQQTERFLLVRQLQQQHNFQANQLLRQFLVGHSGLVADKMTEFLQIMGDKAEGRGEQLSMQCAHAVTRQEVIDEERMTRWRLKQQYSISRLSSREATQRRLLVAESLFLYIREMPNEEKLKRFSMEREFVVEYRGLMKLFISATRIDLSTLLKNCPHSFESGLGDWTRRLVNRETSYFSYHRDRLTIAGACGIPNTDCFVWPADACRQLSLFWCPRFGPPRKKMVVVQGQVTRTVKGRQRVVKLPGSQSKLLGAGTGVESEALTPRGQGPPPTFSAPSSHSRLVDDGPQPLLTVLSVVSSLLNVPSETSGRRFSCLSLVEDIVCWNKVCQQGQVLLGSYQEANLFDDLFASFEESVIDGAEVKWADMVGTRERERLAKLEEAFAGRGPPKVRSKPMTEVNKRQRKGRRRHISDSASSVISADDAASAVSTSETARSRQSTKSGDSDGSQMNAVADIPDEIFTATSARDLSVATLPNYMMGQSFFGTRFMFGASVHLFEKQWTPPITAPHMAVPADISEAWGRSLGNEEAAEDEAQVHDDEDNDEEDEDMDSDFSDGAVFASSRKRDAYLEATKVSQLRHEVKFADRVKAADAEAREVERRRVASIRRYWAGVRQRQDELAQMQGATRPNSGHPGGSNASKGRPVAPLDASLLSKSQEQHNRGPTSNMSSSKRAQTPSSKLSPGTQRNSSPASTRRSAQRKHRSASVVLTDAFDMFDD